MQPIVSFIEELITIPSSPDNKEALATILDTVLKHFEKRGHSIEVFDHEGTKSALVYNQKTRPDIFKVLLNVHLDIIPAKKEQYVPRVEGDTLFGAGAMDMKSSVACLVNVFNEVASTVAYPLALQLTTDEEVGGFKGTKYQIEQGVRADFVLAGEPTNLEIVHKAKGIFQVKVVAHGTTAHGAYPWRGDNALWKLHSFLDKLKNKFPIPDHEVWQTTVNLSRIETSNKALNKVPDTAAAYLDVRFVKEDQAIIQKKIQSCLPEGCEMEVIFFEPAMQTALNDRFVEHLSAHLKEITKSPAILRGANGSSDARHYASVGGAGVEFGPVGGGIGSDDEWVSLGSLEAYCQIIRDFLLDQDMEKL